MKRAIDILASALGIVLLSPLLLLIAIAVKSRLDGPIIYRGFRVGRYGRPFRIMKFRTMVTNAEQVGGSSTAEGDSRVTPAGKVLRKFKLDELPQLFNILLGDMSLVGPRPEVQQFVDLYTDEEKEILSLRPGLTDLATLWNADEGALLAGSADPDRTYLEEIRPEKIRLQLQYLRTRSLLLDMWILMQTVMAVVGRRSPAVESHAKLQVSGGPKR